MFNKKLIYRENMSDNVTKNLKKLMDSLKITGRELARQCGVTPSTIQRMLAGVKNDHRVSSILPVCQALKVSSDELIGLKPLSPRFYPDTTIMNDSEIFLPLISQEDVVACSEQAIDMSLGNWKDWYKSDMAVSDKAFAMQVNDHKNAPVIPENSILIIDPIFEIAQDMLVLVRTQGYGSVSIRKVLIEEPQVYLQPLNTQLPPNPLNESQLIVGKILQIKVNL